jgi:hypothetical protein|nr:MAG TPA: hypothetical protein [Caudoviricetes sp.]
MNDIYESCRKEAREKEQEEIKKWLGECKTIITKGCDECALNNCRGCEHLEKCFDEMMEV